MIKICNRIIILNFIISFIISFFLNTFTISIENIQTTRELLMFLWGVFSVISGLVWLVYVFYHWAMNEFKNKTIKKIWFLVIFFGTMAYVIGPVVYYFTVIEQGKGLLSKDK